MNIDDENLNWLHYIRKEEFNVILNYMPQPISNINVLEIGGGDGFTAKEFKNIGYNIISTDIKMIRLI